MEKQGKELVLLFHHYGEITFDPVNFKGRGPGLDEEVIGRNRVGNINRTPVQHSIPAELGPVRKAEEYRKN
jgi:hypothetical protein